MLKCVLRCVEVSILALCLPLCLPSSVAAQQSVLPPSSGQTSNPGQPGHESPAVAETAGIGEKPGPEPGAPPIVRAARRPAIPPVESTIVVNAGQQTLAAGLAVPYHVTRSEVQSAAGTWGDFTRYLQLCPGVVWNTDMSNDVLVRGGNPSENLFVVDGIEVPNINHISVEGTTGGFASMIDTSTIESVDMKVGTYDARFSSRLSSLIEIRTRENEEHRPGGEVDFGISGGGGQADQPLGQAGSRGDLLLAGHRSVLNLATNDIGLNGVPIYTNGLARLRWSPGTRDSLSALSVNGVDSIDITPQPCDPGVTLNVQTQYEGSRSTDGLIWQHVHGPSALSTLTLTYSVQSQDIGQQLQSRPGGNSGCVDDAVPTLPLYSEKTADRIGSVGYGLQFGRGHWLLSLGTRARAVGLDYQVAQPMGQQSPFNPDPARTDADSFSRDFVAGETGSYLEETAQIRRWTFIVGTREETFAVVGAQSFEPRASLAFRMNAHQGLNASWSSTAQLPSPIDLVSYPANRRLRPMQAKQASMGADLWRAQWVTLTVETYTKRLSSEPVSTEYPGLMLANMVDTLGQQFVWLPLRTGGRGEAGGVEMQLRAHAADRLHFLGALTYARVRYAAADGVLRPGNFDFPLVGNGLVTARLWKGIEISLRDTYAGGRPYTPFNFKLSEQQSRGIYDLTRVNALRGPAYNRVDADLNRDFRLLRGVLNLHGGVENALDRGNFLGYAWMDECHPTPAQTACALNPTAVAGVPETRVMQMPLFPSGAARFSW